MAHSHCKAGRYTIPRTQCVYLIPYKIHLRIWCRFLILLVESWRTVVFSGTVHWLYLKTSFHPLLWTSSGLTCTVPENTTVLQDSFKNDLEWLQQQDIIKALVVNKMSEWCSFALVLKPNGKITLWLDPARHNQALIQPVHRGPPANDMFPKLTNVIYLFLLDASSRYHNLWLVELSSHLTTSASQFGRYRWLSFGAALAGNMFQIKTDNIFK